MRQSIARLQTLVFCLPPLQSVLSGQAMTTGIIQYALLNRFMVLSWALKRLYEAPDDREAIGRFTIARDDFVKQAGQANPTQGSSYPPPSSLPWASVPAPHIACSLVFPSPCLFRMVYPALCPRQLLMPLPWPDSCS